MELTQVIADCASGVPVETLRALVQHESAGNPFAINVNGPHRPSRVPRTRVEAQAVIAEAERRGLSIDIGLGQINAQHLRRFGLRGDDLLDACWNLRLTAVILGECVARLPAGRRSPQHRLAGALSCYNTGDLDRGLRSGYVSAVYRAAKVTPGPVLLPVDALDGWLRLRAKQTAPVTEGRPQPAPDPRP